MVWHHFAQEGFLITLSCTASFRTTCGGSRRLTAVFCENLSSFVESFEHQLSSGAVKVIIHRAIVATCC